MLPPALKYLIAAEPNVERMPAGATGRLEGACWIFSATIFIIQEVYDDRSGVEPKACAQGFERTLLATPQQSEKSKAVRSAGMCDELLFFRCEIVGNKSIAAWLDDFQITSQGRAGSCYRTNRHTGAVAE